MSSYMTNAFREQFAIKVQEMLDEQFAGSKLVIELVSGKFAEIKVSVTSAKGTVLMDIPSRELYGPGCSLIVEGLKIGIGNTVRMDD